MSAVNLIKKNKHLLGYISIGGVCAVLTFFYTQGGVSQANKQLALSVEELQKNILPVVIEKLQDNRMEHLHFSFADSLMGMKLCDMSTKIDTLDKRSLRSWRVLRKIAEKNKITID
jgi:hypothetical protein